MSAPRRKKLAPPPAPPCAIRNEAGAVVGVQWSARLSGSQNSREHHMVEWRRAKAERGTAKLLCRQLARPTQWPVTVLVTRIGPRRIKDDHDNLRAAAKHVVDGVAEALGVDDGDRSKVSWAYAQAKGPYAVRVEIVTVATTEVDDCRRWEEAIGQ